MRVTYIRGVSCITYPHEGVANGGSEVVALGVERDGGVIGGHACVELSVEGDFQTHIGQDELRPRDRALQGEHAAIFALMGNHVQLAVLQDQLLNGRSETDNQNPFAGNFLKEKF